MHYIVPAMIDSPSASINPARAARALRFNAALHVACAGALALAGAGLLAQSGDLGPRWPLTAGALALATGAVLLAALPAALPGNRFGRANSVTLGRLALTCVLAGALGGTHEGGIAWSLCAIAALALALDGLDGWLARRYGEATGFGARFDMEADALFLLVLASLVHASGKAGLWVLLSGLWRYGFVALQLAWPRLRRALPESKRRKQVFVLQAALLTACLAPLVTSPLGALFAALGLAALSLSFAIDLAWLIRTPRPGASAS